MLKSKTIRRVTRRTYDKYTSADYSSLTDNLNPINPTSLETQFSSMVNTIKSRLIAAYNRNKVSVPEELFEADVSPTTIINDIDDLINKLKNNPMRRFFNDFGSIESLTPFTSSTDVADNIMDNPYKLDCSDIELTLRDKSNLFNNAKILDSDNQLSDDQQAENKNAITITYIGLPEEEDMTKYPSTLLESECPLQLAKPTNVSPGYTFKGWYYDEYYNVPIVSNVLDWPGKDIVVWALIDESGTGEFSDSTNDDVYIDPSVNVPEISDDTDCELVELAFLKIIAIVIKIINTLIKVFVLVLNISKVTTEISKDAQFCWVNPVCISSLISYITQRLSAVIFQIVGIIFLKLWSMLKLDCITDNTVKAIDDINQTLAGVTDLLGTIDSNSIQFGNSDASNSTWKNLKESMTSLYDQIREQATNVWDGMTDLGEEFKAAGNDIADTYTNPATYIAAVPSDVRNKVLKSINQYNVTMNNVKQLQAKITKMSNKNAKVQNNPNPKGMEILTF